MIWKITAIDEPFIAAFVPAGEPDQRVIDDYLRKTRRPMQPPKHDGVKRWYYLCRDNPRIRLSCIGRPLDDWKALPAKCLVGTNEIIGEFEGNREFIGQRGSQLTMQPIEWLQGTADAVYASGSAALSEISEQILDKRRIDRRQREVQSKYQWKKP